MATSTIVITYDVAVADGTGEKGAKVTSFTVDGSAYAALTAAEIREAVVLMRAAVSAVIRDAKVPSGGIGDRQVTT